MKNILYILLFLALFPLSLTAGNEDFKQLTIDNGLATPMPPALYKTAQD